MKALNIRKMRIDQGWKLDFVAQKIGLSKQTVQQIETGRRKPSYNVLCSLEDLFGKDHRYLFAQVTEVAPDVQDP